MYHLADLRHVVFGVTAEQLGKANFLKILEPFLKIS